MGVAMVLPKLGLTMEEATLIKWHKEIGDKVENKEVLAEVETDKSTMEIEATSSGILLDKLFEEGDVIPVSKVICHIGEAATEDTYESKAVSNNNYLPEKDELQAKVEYQNHTMNNNPYYGLRMSPAVRKKARLLGLSANELATIKGSGPRNRIVLKDLEMLNSMQTDLVKDENQVTINPPEQENMVVNFQNEKSIESKNQDVISVNRIRSVTARKLAASFRDVPQFIIKKRIDLSNITKVRNTLKSIGIQISLNDFFIQASAKALEKNELVNAYFSDSEKDLKIIKNKDINIGLAVGLDHGLIVPVIKNANQYSLAEIAKKRVELIGKANSNRLSRHEITGGTFTISNLGSYEVEEFTAIINKPESAILALGSMNKQPIVTQDDQIEIRPMLTMIAAFDHRTLDGIDAAKFMKDLGNILESDKWEIV